VAARDAMERRATRVHMIASLASLKGSQLVPRKTDLGCQICQTFLLNPNQAPLSYVHNCMHMGSERGERAWFRALIEPGGVDR